MSLLKPDKSLIDELLSKYFIEKPIENNTPKETEDVAPNKSSYSHFDDRIVKAEVKKLHAESEDRKNDTSLKKGIAHAAEFLAFGSVFAWLLLISGYIFVKLQYEIAIFSDVMFATITTGCTINVLAAFVGVIKGLFKN